MSEKNISKFVKLLGSLLWILGYPKGARVKLIGFRTTLIYYVLDLENKTAEQSLFCDSDTKVKLLKLYTRTVQVCQRLVQ